MIRRNRPTLAIGIYGREYGPTDGCWRPEDRYDWLPFIGATGVFALGFLGLAYNFFPYVILDRMTVWQAASAPESLLFILVGVMVVLPFILGYTVYAYSIFWGKVRELTYY